MLTTVEAEIDVNGNVRLLEPLKVERKSRAILTLLDDDKGKRKPLSAAEEQAAEERCARLIGSAKSGNPRSADNEQIDEDLAREYGATHDDE